MTYTDNLITDTTVVSLTEEQYNELIQSLHTLQATNDNVVGVLGALFAVLLVAVVLRVLWDVTTNITQYF